MEVSISLEQFAAALVILIAAAIVVTKLVDGLKAAGAVPEGAAGKVNQGLAFVIALAGFLLRYFGQSGKVAEAETLGLELAAALVSTYVIAFLAYLIHQGVKRISPPKPAALRG